MSDIWSKEQEAVLKEKYASTCTNVLGRMLKKDPKAIRSKASKLGLKKSDSYKKALLKKTHKQVYRRCVFQDDA